jgi:DNA invertase Pin-like site-specific DNA recombinase
MKAFSYLRVSSKGQVDKDGFPRQRQTIAATAKNLGIEIVKEYHDDGVTGESDWFDRPSFQAMISDILANGVRSIIVENLTRLARSYVVTDAIIVYLASKGITLISADTGEDVTAAFHGDPMKKALIQMQAVFAELEKNTLIRKLRAARVRARQEKGSCEGRKAFGERDGESVTMDLIRSLRRKPKGGKRMPFASIAEKLNQDGVPTRTGKPWHPEVIRRLLGAER